MEVVSHHLKLTRCYILQTKIVHTLFKRVETFFFITIVKVISLVTQELGTLFIYIYIYILKCLPFSVYWLYPSHKQPNKTTKEQKGKKNTTRRGREGTANSPHKPDPKEHPKKPPRNIWSLFTDSERKGTYKKQGKQWLKMAVIHRQATKKSLYPYAILTPVAAEGCFA